MQRRHLLVVLLLLVAVLSLLPLTSGADESTGRGIVVRRDAAELFVILPDGVRFPEGIAANPRNGDIFVATFDTDGTHPNKLLRYDRHGNLLATKDFGGQAMLGLEFNRADHKVYICNFGASKIQRIPANFNSSTPVEDVVDIPSIGAPGDRTEPNPDGSSDTIKFGSNGFPAPNALTFNRHGDLFISDSFQGAVFKVNSAASCGPCPIAQTVHDTLLATAGFPPFGANGLAFNRDESLLYIANTGDDRVLKMDTTTNVITVLAESINGADGLVFHGKILWVCANQADEIVGLNEFGRPIVKLGDFLGINRNGTPRGLLFPASPVIVHGKLFVTNLAIPLTPAVGD